MYIPGGCLGFLPSTVVPRRVEDAMLWAEECPTSWVKTDQKKSHKRSHYLKTMWPLWIVFLQGCSGCECELYIIYEINKTRKRITCRKGTPKTKHAHEDGTDHCWSPFVPQEQRAQRWQETHLKTHITSMVWFPHFKHCKNCGIQTLLSRKLRGDQHWLQKSYFLRPNGTSTQITAVLSPRIYFLNVQKDHVDVNVDMLGVLLYIYVLLGSLQNCTGWFCVVHGPLWWIQKKAEKMPSSYKLCTLHYSWVYNAYNL